MSSKKKVKTAEDLQALFKLKTTDRPDNLMKVWIKGSEKQSIYTALAPKSNVLKKDSGTAPSEVFGDSIQTLIIKREASAWENPFAMVFNPYFEGKDNPIAEVNYSSIKENPSTQVINVSLNDDTTDTIILNTTEEDVVEKDGVYQKGIVIGCENS
ncbi:hypothetical protein M601_019860 [Cellulophaga baltica 4]|nr:hypothetical protein M601_019860 [Cellulophaga baltica 4]